MKMARPGVTYQDIANAAHELKGQEKRVTIENVRAILGTGSIGTINQHLRKWKEAQATTQGVAAKENLPESLIALMKGLWEGVLDQSSEQFYPVEEAYKQEILELKAELEKYKNNNQRWQKMFNQWQQEKASLANENLTLEQALEFAHKENQSLQDKQDGLHHQLQEKQERIDELHRLHQQTQHNLEHYRESAREQRLLDQQQFESEKQRLLAEIKILKEKEVTQHQEIILFEKKNTSLLESNQFLEQNYSQCQKEIEQLKVEIKVVEKECHEYRASCETYQNQNKQLLATSSKQSSQMIEHQAENKILLNKLGDLTNELSTIKDQHKLASHEKWEIMQEKASLEGQLKQMQKSFAG
jgi:chromosome segregation ATPase